jgi:Skp family chaperone for outer membrane proteins
MSRLKLLCFLAFSLLFLGSTAWAQPWRDAKDPREKARDRIQMIKMMRLTETLKLDQEGAARFFAVSNQYEENKRKIRKELHEDLERLRHLMRDLNPPEKELREIISRMKNRRKDMDALSQRQMEEELSLLRLDQQARYIIFTVDFRRDMDELIREAREERPPRPAPGSEAQPVRVR